MPAPSLPNHAFDAMNPPTSRTRRLLAAQVERDELARLREREKRLVAALEFYAKPEGWEDVSSGIGTLPGPAIDYGARARQAIAETGDPSPRSAA